MQNLFGLLNTDVMPMRFSINYSAVICSPTVIYAILTEATSETYGPWSILHYISFRYTILVYYLFYFAIFYFPFYKPKNSKNIYFTVYLCLSDLTFASDREGIDNPFIALVARFLIVCAGTRRLACNLLLD